MSDKPASPARGRKKTAPPAQQPPQEEVVVRLPLTDLYPFPDHPFQVRDDEEMKETIQSVKEYGVIVPAIVRPREEGGYEIVAGHRRKYACEQAGLDTMPVLIRNLDRDAATIIMVDSNLQRENILPSERAKAYKMKLEANQSKINQILWRYIMEFFNSAVDVLQTLVIALGAGLGIWGVINLLEGYGNDNPGANAHVP